MTGNKIGDEGAKAMSEMMKVNTTLKELYLKREEEGKKGKRKEQEEERMNNRE